ncbi:MarR family winged helix-turn-helix transcriptional regulator [Actinomycetospora soli]|uniref:MarR family winged helix-turn-helix transcriptional regulator n=1 Tax=Actinomycetospora soli TaxID=2893887 RepID=UPI001E2ABA8B|nr:MarR family winged helix-turn-helix transcriptional regulator [Actinomycetospora soli]MCD2190442.1 MarR family winged helix-turn-helix transcriptional regulator [Actinomycetospora soli]
MPELWSDERVAALPSWSVIRTHLLLAPRLARTLAAVGLSPTQFGVLVQLDNTPGATSSDLARACLMTPQSMSELLPGLEAAGYVERTPAGRGRPAPVHLTAGGHDALARATPLVEDADRPEALGLDADELATLTTLLNRVADQVSGS